MYPVSRSFGSPLIPCLLACLGMSLASLSPPAAAQLAALGDGPWYYQTQAPALSIKVSVVARGIRNPWGMAFLPSGNILIAEKPGQFRLVLPETSTVLPVSGSPEVRVASGGGLMDLTLHPDFEANRLVYFTYVKNAEPPPGSRYHATTVLARGRLNEAENALEDVADLFVAEAWSSNAGGHGARLRFAPDGTLFMSSPFRRDDAFPQDPGSHIGKLLRLNDDGTVPADNPFVGRAGYLPEIWSIGHRAMEGLVFHPDSGELWGSEHGPLGGDELNIIHKGGNYGWPDVSYGRDYSGVLVSPLLGRADILPPELLWIPSIAPSGLMFYTGEHFPEWHNNLFSGSLMTGRVPATGHLERIAFNEDGEETREWLLTDLRQRIRDVQQGPDGLIYILTEESDGALLVMEPYE